MTQSIDAEFASMRRHDLDGTSWVDHAEGWVLGADDLFAELADALPWRQRTDIPMYDQLVTEPRLTWWGPLHGTVELPAIVTDIHAALSERYGEPLDAVGANLYRDGNDSVAWHRDRNRFTHPTPLVAIVSLGARRPFRMRPHQRSAPFESLTWHPGEGDLLVMGGACQHDWEHTVPKLSRATGPRISLMFRTGRDG